MINKIDSYILKYIKHNPGASLLNVAKNCHAKDQFSVESHVEMLAHEKHYLEENINYNDHPEAIIQTNYTSQYVITDIGEVELENYTEYDQQYKETRRRANIALYIAGFSVVIALSSLLLSLMK